MSLEKIEARWRTLDPVFVRGMQRSGTSVMEGALQRMGIRGFAEGHLWFELLGPLTQLRDPTYRPDYRADVYALGENRLSALEKYIAVALDQFHRDHLPPLKRWMDKSPGADAVRFSPLLAELFPKAQFIFMYRNGITTVQSGVKLWKDDPNIFQTMCRGWAETMSTWRQIRDKLHGRYIEIAQEELVTHPHEVAARLTNFLGAPRYSRAVAELFISKRVLSAFPDKAPGDYRYRVDWDDEQKAYFEATCGAEMAAWGYEIDYESPGVARAGDLTRPEAHTLERTKTDRVIRFLNWLSHLKGRKQ